MLQSSDDVRHVGELALLRPHFRFDTVQLPCPTLRTAERANRYGLSVMQRGQLLQLDEQFRLDFWCGQCGLSSTIGLPLCSGFVRCHARRFGGAEQARQDLASLRDACYTRWPGHS